MMVYDDTAWLSPAAAQHDVRPAAMRADFENRITQGFAQWITFVEADETRASVRVGITHHPGTDARERVVEFPSVRRVSSDWFDQDDECSESLLGAHEERNGDSMRYIFHTDQRDLRIWADDRVTIKTYR